LLAACEALSSWRTISNRADSYLAAAGVGRTSARSIIPLDEFHHERDDVPAAFN
jgi:hypothetical protein